MSYLILTLVSVLGGVFAFIYKLLQDNRTLKTTIATHEAMREQDRLQQKFNDTQSRLTVEERDYEKAKSEFEHPGSAPLPPGGKQ